MIGQIRGILTVKQPPLLVIEAYGVGYEIEAPMTTFYDLPDTGTEILLYTHLVVREDAHLLFGFATENERRLFRTLIKINGVGAKMALTILDGSNSRRALSLETTSALGKITVQDLTLRNGVTSGNGGGFVRVPDPDRAQK